MSLHTDLPDDVNEIIDIYRIITSTRQLDLNMFLQRGVTEHHQRLQVSFKERFSHINLVQEVLQKVAVNDDEWDVMELQVQIKK